MKRGLTNLASLVDQLRRNFERIGATPPERSRQVRLVFLYSEALTVDSRGSLRTLSFECFGDAEALTRCPIYRALSYEQQRELILRAPKFLLRFASYGWNLLYEAQDAYKAFAPGGVSPLTAVALLIPEPRYELRSSDLSPNMVLPEPFVCFDPKTNRPISRRTEHWQIVIWALKRYTPLAWRDVSNLATDIRRSPLSLRQSVRRSVEEPLLAAYRKLTGKKPPSALVSCALSDRPDSEKWSRERMRDLKRAANRDKRLIPNN